MNLAASEASIIDSTQRREEVNHPVREKIPTPATNTAGPFFCCYRIYFNRGQTVVASVSSSCYAVAPDIKRRVVSFIRTTVGPPLISASAPPPHLLAPSGSLVMPAPPPSWVHMPPRAAPSSFHDHTYTTTSHSLFLFCYF
ncbi:hypothetical protein PIB30_021674 [Stylosanthes scabra]|uniref:Uncharacterized protein n=1 Tax=Stylosanthes scabra TaxID=79078 RepID=A0ABU6Z5J7_9FABA|nr:hypothetical protein [Stylosanthes scabra]